MKRNTRKRATERGEQSKRAKPILDLSLIFYTFSLALACVCVCVCVCNVVFVRCLGISSLLIPHDRAQLARVCVLFVIALFQGSLSRLEVFFLHSRRAARSLKITHQFNIWGVCCSAIWELALLFHSQSAEVQENECHTVFIINREILGCARGGNDEFGAQVHDGRGVSRSLRG
jgi:hypothetical protein